MELLHEIFMFLELLEFLDGISFWIFWSFWMSYCKEFLCLPALLEDPDDHESLCFLDPPWILFDLSTTQLQHHVSKFQVCRKYILGEQHTLNNRP